MNTDRVWLSCHVFYHGDADGLVVDLVLPMLDDLLRRELVQRRFFLRHWERGPHVRIRMLVGSRDVDAVRAEVEARITAHLAEHPGPLDVDQGRLQTSLNKLSVLEHGSTANAEVLTAEPPNVLRWIDYEPESAKYGGPDGVRIAEDVFDVSSLLAGQVLRQVASDGARLGIALQMLLIACRSLGLDPAARAVFLRSYQERWQGYLPDAPRLLSAWAKQYEHQRETYRALLADLDAGAPIGKGVGLRWEQTLDDAIRRLRPLVENGRVWPSEVDRGAPAFVAVAALVCQYLHTTNNRMNVRPQGECFVAYLAHTAVTESLSNPPTAAGREGLERHVG